MKKELVKSSIIIIVILAGVCFPGYLWVQHERDDGFKTKLLNDMLAVQKMDKTQMELLHQKFVNNCLLARQVYQFSWYHLVDTKVGKLYLQKCYAMSLQEYNDLIEQSWAYNRLIGLPAGGWEDYVMLSKWIMESAINNYAEHKTGEIIRMAGYTYDGFIGALYVYLYKMGIGPGHPLYIPELFRSGMSETDIKKTFENVANIVKFDYGYIWGLLRSYNYDWPWALTGFHFGEDKTIYWKDSGLKMVPNYRIDGKWNGYFMREYYQAILEIAQGISLGRCDRISRFEEIAGNFRRMDEIQSKYVRTYALKLKSTEKCDEMEGKLRKVNDDFRTFKEVNAEIICDMGRLNDLTLDYRNTTAKEIKAWMGLRISRMKVHIAASFRRLMGQRPSTLTNQAGTT